jgi:hypothetical protein
MQLRLEGKSITGRDCLRQVEIVPDEEMPLMIIAQLADGQVVAYYDESLPLELHAGLEKQVSGIQFPVIDSLLDFLKSGNISIQVGHYKTYVFPAYFADRVDPDTRRLPRENPLVQAFGFGRFAEHVYAIEREGRIASACVSTLENGECGEAWVYTDSQNRRHGFAQRVVGAWAQNMIAAGKVPFYSHKVENTASANLAKSLGLEPVFEEISISYTKV